MTTDRRHLQLVSSSARHGQHTSGGSMDSDLERLIDTYTLPTTSGICPAFTQRGARVLKAALSHLQLTALQVAALNRWIQNHNGFISFPRSLMRNNRGCLSEYLRVHQSSYLDELQALFTTSMGMDYHPDEWELRVLQGFFLACHVIVQLKTTTPSTLRLL